MPSSVYERIYKASFDERLSVVNLLTSGLAVYFDKTFLYHFIADQWYRFLKNFKEKARDCQDTARLYEQLYKDYEADTETKRKAGFYTRQQEGCYSRLLEMLWKNKPDKISASEAFCQAKEGFSKWNTELEELEDKTGAVLENVFDFMEAAFGNSQEMVVFITELTMDSKAVSYLSENKCERYLKYNEELMAGTKKAQILSMLEKDEIYGKEHIREF